MSRKTELLKRAIEVLSARGCGQDGIKEDILAKIAARAARANAAKAQAQKLLDRAAVTYQLVLTKVDYLKKAELPRAIAAAEAVALQLADDLAQPLVLDPLSRQHGLQGGHIRRHVTCRACCIC